LSLLVKLLGQLSLGVTIIERSFQNWTRVSADILGTVFLYMDYTVPVRVIREELQKIVKGSDLWDGKVCGVQVTGATQQTIEVRALVSAADSSKAWDLRCLVREKLLEFLQNKYPAGLPKTRVEMKKSILVKIQPRELLPVPFKRHAYGCRLEWYIWR
jgi:hypothetical protein